MHAVEAFELVLALLAMVTGLYWLALKLHLPPATALLVGGGALAFIPGLPSISLDPELALVLSTNRANTNERWLSSTASIATASVGGYGLAEIHSA
ncbi:MAG: Na+/H+ antiporter, partial [Pseudomonadota bacterium]